MDYKSCVPARNTMRMLLPHATDPDPALLAPHVARCPRTGPHVLARRKPSANALQLPFDAAFGMDIIYKAPPLVPVSALHLIVPPVRRTSWNRALSSICAAPRIMHSGITVHMHDRPLRASPT